MPLRFVCQPGCIACCDQTGYVYLSEADVLRAAAFLNLTPEEFEARYTYRTRHQIRLRKPKDSQCHFLRGNGCGIHPAKPTQCRTFPYWPEIVDSEEELKNAATYCPGIGHGDIVPVSELLQAAKDLREAYPTFYPVPLPPKPQK